MKFDLLIKNFTMTSILLVATIQSWFFVFLIWRFKAERQLSDYILAIWFVLIGLHTLLHFLFLNEIELNIHLLILNALFPFLQGPLLYLYTLAKTGRIKMIRIIHFVHAIPFVFFLLYQLFPLYFPRGNSSGEVHNVFSTFFSTANPFGILFLILSPFYLFLSYKLTLNTQRELENKNWIRLMILFFACIWIFSLLGFFIPELVNHHLQIGLNYLIFITLTGFIYLVSYLGFKENIFSTDIPKIGGEKYQKSRLSEEEVFQIWSDLSRNMNEEKSFLDPNLNLMDLSNAIETTSNKLSQVINIREGKSFYDFVNALRVQHAKSMMSSVRYNHYTVLGIGFDSGFSSKSTFNRAFKKTEGLTPSKYQAIARQNRNE
jgi:AraC-like DNA-binding protein